MARSKSKKLEIEEVESEPPSEEVREEGESFSGADPAFSELKRAPIEQADSNHMVGVSAHQRILDFLEEFRKATVNIVFAGIVGLLLLTAVKVINADELAIDPVSLPKTLKDMGYTEVGVALALSDNMFKIFNEVRLNKHDFSVKAKIEEADFAVPVAGLSFSSAIRLIRQMAGFPQRHVSGEIICTAEPCSGENLELHLRVSDGVHPPQLIEPVKSASTETMLTAGAEKLLRIVDPMSLAVFLYGEGDKNIGRRPEAIDIARSALNGSSLDRATALNMLGAELMDQPAVTGEMAEKAIGFYVMATQADPTYYPAFGNLGVALVNKGLREGAIENFKKAIALKEDVPVLHMQLGNAYFEGHDFPAAIAEFKRASEIDPNDHVAKNAWGAALYQKGELDASIEQLNASLALNPKFSVAYANLGYALKDKGKKVEAKASFEAALNLETSETAKAQLADLIKGLQ